MRLAALALLAATTAAAQPGWRAVPAEGPLVSLDVLYALGDDIPVVATDIEGTPTGGGEVGAFNAVAVLRGRAPIGTRLAVVGEVPIGYAAFDYPTLPSAPGVPVPEDASDVGLGNPYLGVEVQVRDAVSVSGGVRIPLAASSPFDIEGWQAGLAAEMERFEAYLPDTFTASLSVLATPRLGDALRARIRVEPALLVPTTDQTSSDGADLALGAALGLDARVGAATVSGGLLTRRILTSGRYDLGGVFDADAVATLGASAEVGGVRPGVGVRVPLSDSAFGQDATVALWLDVPLR